MQLRSYRIETDNLEVTTLEATQFPAKGLECNYFMTLSNHAQ